MAGSAGQSEALILVAVLAVVLQHATAGAHTQAVLAGAFGDAFWWSVAFTAAAVPVCLLLPGRAPVPATPDPAEAESVVLV
ncbi:hypothetical protein BCD48_25975 [Pseudofrankia sp. BMG5.36]|nr:hypothetical protein BCD48_25975 [Pseudofrankia sp. BMG5.36]